MIPFGKAGISAMIALSIVLSGCGLPRSGPTKAELFAGSVQRKGDAFVVEVNDRVTKVTSGVKRKGWDPRFLKAAKVNADIIRPGDLLQLTIWENTDTPLLGVPGQNISQINELQVDSDGFIFVPYAGRIRVAGKTPDEVRQILTRKLDAQTPDPQIVVRRLADKSGSVTILGAVAGQGVYPIQHGTRTLASMLAKAGGVAIKPEIAKVTLTRGKHQGSVWLKDLYEDPRLDIALRPGDKILVDEDDRRFTVLGATGQQALVKFQTPTLSALEAIAQIGGLNPLLADPKGVFVLRYEPEEVAHAVLGRNDLKGTQRFIYVLDLTRPNGMFLARDFLIRDGDTLYVTEAPFVQWKKVLTALSSTTSSVNSLQGAVQ